MTRFELEQEILNCWHVVEDLKTLNEAVLEDNLTSDQVSNILMGMSDLYQIKFDKAFRLFEKYVQEQEHPEAYSAQYTWDDMTY